MNPLYKIIPFNVRHGNCGGSLVQFQEGESDVNALPFEIGKVLVMSDIRIDDVRGNHAHYETEEILVALTGGCVVDLDDGKGRKETVFLSSLEVRDQTSDVSNPTSGLRPPTSDKAALLLYPHIWRTMRDFEPGTMLMVIANIPYDESDYIRDRVEFEKIAAGWKTLGGSSARCAEARSRRLAATSPAESGRFNDFNVITPPNAGSEHFNEFRSRNILTEIP